jgi:hypothetical protein
MEVTQSSGPHSEKKTNLQSPGTFTTTIVKTLINLPNEVKATTGTVMNDKDITDQRGTLPPGTATDIGSTTLTERQDVERVHIDGVSNTRGPKDKEFYSPRDVIDNTLRATAHMERREGGSAQTESAWKARGLVQQGVYASRERRDNALHATTPIERHDGGRAHTQGLRNAMGIEEQGVYAATEKRDNTILITPTERPAGKRVYTRGAVTARDEKENRVIAPLSNTGKDQKANGTSCVNETAEKLTTYSTLSDKNRRGKELSNSADIENTSAAQSDVPSTRSVTAGKTTTNAGMAMNVLTEEKPEKVEKKQNKKIIEKKVRKEERKTVKKFSKKDLKKIKDASYYEGTDDSSDGEAKI